MALSTWGTKLVYTKVTAANILTCFTFTLSIHIYKILPSVTEQDE